MKPFFEYEEYFLTDEEAEYYFRSTLPLPMLPEIGTCNGQTVPTHSTIHFGPRQAYLSCAPEEFRVKSSGPIPSYLLPVTERLRRRYDFPFNSVQINNHYDHNSIVGPHSDAQEGPIPMLSFNAERRFLLTYKKDDPAKTLNRFKAGDVLFDRVLRSGSLLTLLPPNQHTINHEMPISETPCGNRVSLIFRFIPDAMTKTLSGRKMYAEGSIELKQARLQNLKVFKGDL